MKTAEVRDLLRRADTLLDPLGDPHGDLDRLFGRDHGRGAPTMWSLLYGYGGRTVTSQERFPENEDRPDRQVEVEQRAVPATPETLTIWDEDARSEAAYGRITGEVSLHRGGDMLWARAFSVSAADVATAMREFTITAERAAELFAGFRQRYVMPSPLLFWDRVAVSGWTAIVTHDPEPAVPAPAPPVECSACECAPPAERSGATPVLAKPWVSAATPVLAEPWVSAAAWRRPGEATYAGTGAAVDVAEVNRRAVGSGPAQRSRRERGW